MKYNFESASTDRQTQKEAALLLGRIFPDYWEQIAAKNLGFPFEEVSFAARTENGQMCAHAGIMPFMISDGAGGTLRFAGIASVAVDPQFRGQGLASTLCEAAAEWAAKNGFDALPLFTGKYGVYSGHGWKQYPVNPPRKIVLSSKTASSGRFVFSDELSEQDKEQITLFYERSIPFAGKVLRTNGNSFHAWKRIFREPGFQFFLSESGYALRWSGAVVELCTEPGAEMEVLSAMGTEPFTIALSRLHPVWSELKQRGCLTNVMADDVFHGESVMMRSIGDNIPEDLYFPCADKF